VNQPLRAVIIGLGYIGRRHLANIRTLAPASQILIYRHAQTGSGREEIPGADNVVYDLDAVIDFKPHIAVLSNPATLHVTAAAALASANTHLLVEKPISHSLAGVVELISECQRRRLVLMVGYTLRFNASLQAARKALRDGLIGRPAYIRAEVGSHLADWRPEADYRQTVSARKELGGGVVFELSHEIDYVRWFVGEVATVSARLGTLGDLELEVEDTAEITLEMRNGTMASIHLDMLQRPGMRGCRIVGTNGTLLWDGIKNSVMCYSTTSKEWSTIYNCAERYNRNEMYLAELEEFFASVQDGRAPAETCDEGLRALEIALAAKRSHEDAKTNRL
jgi:predicted dehydrogenase